MIQSRWDSQTEHHDATRRRGRTPSVFPARRDGAAGVATALGKRVGVVSAKLSARAAFSASGSLPENVNYAVKSSFLLGFLESMPELSAKLKEPETKERKFDELVKSAEQAAVLVLVYCV